MAYPEDVVGALNATNLLLTGGQGSPRRVPMILSSSARALRGIPPIRMSINPQSVVFQQAKRIVKRDTQRGSTWFHFSDENGYNNDCLKIAVSGVTGNVDTRAQTLLGGNLVGGPKKLQNWANLYQLTREPMIDRDLNREIQYYITYASALFPAGWTFIGFFDACLNFNESADQPFLKNWSFGFTVTDTFPDLDNIYQETITTLQGLDFLSKVGMAVNSIGNWQG